jgi:hypothetical protein
MHEILTSKEFWSALFGALAAFLLEALRRRAADRKHELAAGNEAVFALAQIHTLATLIFNQAFKDREAEVRRAQHREPTYFEFLPMIIPWNASIKLSLDRLGFVLASYHPDLLNRLAAVDREFAAVIQAVTERNTQYNEFRRRFVGLPKSSQAIRPEMIEDLVGVDVREPLRTTTEALRRGLPRCAEHAHLAGKQLSEMLSYHSPLARVSRFTPIARTTALDAPHVTAPAWRRAVRGLVTRLRRPTGVILPPDATLE